MKNLSNNRVVNVVNDIKKTIRDMHEDAGWIFDENLPDGLFCPDEGEDVVGEMFIDDVLKQNFQFQMA